MPLIGTYNAATNDNIFDAHSEIVKNQIRLSVLATAVISAPSANFHEAKMIYSVLSSV